MHRITEVAIIIRSETKELDRYETLINPGVPIPRNITHITGISDEMVEDAPTFNEVAPKIFEMLEGQVFVAHNVNFDYGFIRHHLLESGIKWSAKRLCTVRLSRKLLPGMYSYSLGKLAQQMGHEIKARHRAMGDCEFTAELFQELLNRDDQEHIDFALNQRNREATLPPLLSRQVIEKLPNTLGIYLFYDAKGTVIYVGKAKDLKHRVSEHFRGSTHTGYKSRFAEQIANVTWYESPNELLALLMEAREIKKHWPRYNRMMKRVTLNWGIFAYKDQNGYGRLSVGRVGKWDKPVVSFRSQFEARQSLDGLRQKFKLCARYCGLQELEGMCAEEVHGACNKACIKEESSESYNLRWREAQVAVTRSGMDLVIHGKGFSKQEQSIVLIERGRYKGHALIPKDTPIDSLAQVRNMVESAYDDQDMQAIIQSYLNRKRAPRVTLLSD